MSEPRQCAACASSSCSRPDTSEVVALADRRTIGVLGDHVREKIERVRLRRFVV